MAERWQTGEGRLAAVFFRDTSGAPVTGLTPSATSNYKDGTAGAPVGTVAEVANGFYRVTFATAPTKDVLVRVDGGASLTSTRYIALEVPVGGYVDTIATASAVAALSTAITALGSPAQATDTAMLLARLTAARAVLLDQLDPALTARLARLADVQVTVNASPEYGGRIG